MIVGLMLGDKRWEKEASGVRIAWEEAGLYSRGRNWGTYVEQGVMRMGGGK